MKIRALRPTFDHVRMQAVPEGAEIEVDAPLDTFWTRRLFDGDIVEVAEEKARAEVTTEPAARKK